MDKWQAIYINDPDDDYNVMLELQYGEQDYGCIKKTKNGLVLTWYSNANDVTVPVDWLHNILDEVQHRLK